MNLIKLWDLLIKKENPPWCVDCVFCVPSTYAGEHLYCRHPKVDPVGGKSLNVPCVTSRQHYCKPRGKYFEPKAQDSAPRAGEKA